jgi:hypothetical protein
LLLYESRVHFSANGFLFETVSSFIPGILRNAATVHSCYCYVSESDSKVVKSWMLPVGNSYFTWASDCFSRCFPFFGFVLCIWEKGVFGSPFVKKSQTS